MGQVAEHLLATLAQDYISEIVVFVDNQIERIAQFMRFRINGTELVGCICRRLNFFKEFLIVIRLIPFDKPV